MNRIPSEKKVLILGARSPMALELARSFKRRNVKIILADSLRFPIARWTNTKSQYYLLPSPNTENEGWIKRLKSIIEKHEVTDCIPTCEEAFHLAAIVDLLPCKTWVSKLSLMNELHKKDAFVKMYEGIFKAPTTISFEKFTDYENTTNFVFKKKYSRFADDVLIRPQREVLEKTIQNKSEWIAQEFISGKEYCVYSIWDQGIMRTCSIYHPRMRAGKGAGTFFERVDHHLMENKVRALGERLGYTGQLSLDIIESAGILFPLECNPRATSGGHLIPDVLADAFLEEGPKKGTSKNHRAVKLAALIYNPSVIFSRKFHRAKDVVFSWRDIKPSLLQIVSLMELIYISFRENISLLAASTKDIEWNGYKEEMQ